MPPQVSYTSLSQTGMNPSHYSTYHNEYDPYQTPASGKGSFPQPQTTRPPQPPSIHPFTLFLLVIWVVFVAALMWLLERAVTLGPKDPTPPWTLTVLPDLLLTVFAQGHSVITAMHLSRIAVSALQYSSSAPNTWRELFWLTDGTWQGPLSIATTAYQTIRLRAMASMTYILFATTCMVALVTPLVLTRAYPTSGVDVLQNVDIRPSTMLFKNMEHVDGYLQLGAGMGSWGTALSILDVHNTSTFTPPDVAREGNPEDFFFAGDVRDATATLPGLRLQGRCKPTDSSSLDATDLVTSFGQFCRNKIPNFQDGGRNAIASGDLTIQLQFCNNASWASPFSINATSISNVAYIYYNYSSTGGSPPGNALIQCDSKMSMGTAKVSGTNHTFVSFDEQPLFNVSASTGGEPVLDPLYAVLYYLGSSGNKGPLISDAEVRGLGFQAETDTQSKAFSSPSPDDIAAAFWRAVSHVTTGTSILSRSSDVSYPATVARRVTVYTKLMPWAYGAYGLLGVWLLLLLIVTAWCYRPTFSASLDSYVAGRLIADRQDLIAGHPYGDADANENLGTPFEPVRKDGSRKY